MVNKRFKEHIDDPNKGWDERRYQIKEIRTGDWTPYETAVWEKYYIDQARAENPKLVNSKDVPPISEEKYNQYKHLHNPCG